MKIGKFCEKYDVTQDAVRYYIELGLLLPDKKGTFYDFNKTCETDILEIKRLKNMKFKLNEIQRLLSLSRLGVLENQEEFDYYMTLLKSKKNELLEDRLKIEESINMLDRKIENIIKLEKELSSRCKRSIGFPINYVNLIHCPSCNEMMDFSAQNIEKNMVYNGEFNCDCGYKLSLKDGIVTDDQKDFEKVKCIELEEYLKEMGDHYVNYIYKVSNYPLEKINKYMDKKSIILDLGKSKNIFLKTMINNLGKNNLYILVCESYSRVRILKEAIESNRPNSNFIFMAVKYPDIPLKEECVDIFIDSFGTSHYNRYKKDFIVSDMTRYMKLESYFVGLYLYANKSSKIVKNLDIKLRDNFIKDNIKDYLIKTNLESIDISELGYNDKWGKYEGDFFISGEKIYTLGYLGQRKER